jgi:hypothetical protein
MYYFIDNCMVVLLIINEYSSQNSLLTSQGITGIVILIQPKGRKDSDNILIKLVVLLFNEDSLKQEIRSLFIYKI